MITNSVVWGSIEQTEKDIDWTQIFGGDNNDGASSLLQSTDTGFALAGYTWSYGAGAGDMWLLKTDINGSEQQNQTYGGLKSDGAMSLLQTTDASFVLAGYTNHDEYNGSDLWYCHF